MSRQETKKIEHGVCACVGLCGCMCRHSRVCLVRVQEIWVVLFRQSQQEVPQTHACFYEYVDVV